MKEIPRAIKLFMAFNKTDWEIMDLLSNSKDGFSVGEITNHLQIAPVNTWKHLKTLEKYDMIIVPKVQKGKKKIIKLNHTTWKKIRDLIEEENSPKQEGK